MIARTFKAKVFVFAVFFIGIATGILILNFYERRVTGTRQEGSDRATRVERAQRDVLRMQDYLGLSDEQRQQVTEILETTRNEFRELQKQTRPQFEAIQEASRNKIRAVLNEDQQQKYDEFRAAQNRRRGRRN
jgi:hypothetical protein